MTTASWQPDPMHRHEFRWWDGQSWTEHVNDGGVASVDPVSAAPTVPTQPLTVQPMPPSPAMPPMPPMGAQPYQASGASQGWGAPTADVHHAATVPSASTPLGNPQFGSTPIGGSTPLGGSTPATYGAGPEPIAPKRKTGLIVAGVVAVAAIGAGAFFLLGGDDDKEAVTAATSTSSAPDTTDDTTTTDEITTTVPRTTVPRTTQPATTVPRTTVPPVVTPTAAGAALAATLPTDADAPADWAHYSDPDAAPVANEATGFCAEGDNTYRAQSYGNLAAAYGTTWDLPTGGWFGVDAYQFDSVAAAQGYLDGTDAQANGCMNASPQGTAPESEAKWFEDGYGDDAVWSWVRNSGSYYESSPTAETFVRTVSDEFLVTNYDGIDYGVTYTSFARFERYGSIVLVFWLDGSHDYTGFDSQPEWAYTPTNEDLDAAAATVRPGILERLLLGGLA